MAIDIKCPHCGDYYDVDDTLSGKIIRCRRCRKYIDVPTALIADTKREEPPPLINGNPNAEDPIPMETPLFLDEGILDKELPIFFFYCSFCGAKNQAKVSMIGRIILCEICKGKIIVPDNRKDLSNNIYINEIQQQPRKVRRNYHSLQIRYISAIGCILLGLLFGNLLLVGVGLLGMIIISTIMIMSGEK